METQPTTSARWPVKILKIKTTATFTIIGMAALLAFVISCATMKVVLDKPAIVPGAQFIGNATCLSCHDQARHVKLPPQHQNCESCHGAGSLHADNPGKDNIVYPTSGNCLACHKGEGAPKHTDQKALIAWNFSDHKKAGIQCSDCHDPHATQTSGLKVKSDIRMEKVDVASQMCLGCHQEQLGRINMPYHHPIREGAMGCLSCHDPHGSQKRSLLHKNEACFKCHQHIQGPFAREHAPVVENCSNCHDPHGSPHKNMVKVGQPMLCLQCHSLADNRHAVGAPPTGSGPRQVSPAALRDCTACHGAIHGSDMEPYYRH